MKNLITFLAAGLMLVVITFAQSPQAVTSTGHVPPNEDTKATVGDEERMIRAAYEKLMHYQKATVLFEFKGKEEELPEAELLKYTLKNFYVGPIEQIKESLLEEFAPSPTGEILYFQVGHRSENGGPSSAHYRAVWKAVEQRGERWFKPKVSDLYNFEASSYFDVGKYVTYDVSVAFKGKTKQYKAAALIHNLHESAAQPRPEIWDPHVDNDPLNHILAEKAPPLLRSKP